MGAAWKTRQLGSNWGGEVLFYIRWWGKSSHEEKFEQNLKEVRERARDILGEKHTRKRDQEIKKNSEAEVHLACPRTWVWLEARNEGERSLDEIQQVAWTLVLPWCRWELLGSFDQNSAVMGLTCKRITFAATWASDGGGARVEVGGPFRRFLQ